MSNTSIANNTQLALTDISAQGLIPGDFREPMDSNNVEPETTESESSKLKGSALLEELGKLPKNLTSEQRGSRCGYRNVTEFYKACLKALDVDPGSDGLRQLTNNSPSAKVAKNGSIIVKGVTWPLEANQILEVSQGTKKLTIVKP